jgi:hypothetical protein
VLGHKRLANEGIDEDTEVEKEGRAQSFTRNVGILPNKII